MQSSLDQRSSTYRYLSPIRDGVLEHAEPLDGATLLDVGTGDGLIGLDALDRVGSQGTVIFSDVSTALLEQSRQAVAARDRLDRARFVVTGAEDLAAIPDGSVDVATTRSVLISSPPRRRRSPPCTACCAQAAASRSSSPSTV